MFISTLIAAVSAVVLACIYLWFAAKFPRQLIISTIVANISLYVASAGLLAYMSHQASKDDPNAG